MECFQKVLSKSLGKLEQQPGLNENVTVTRYNNSWFKTKKVIA